MAKDASGRKAKPKGPSKRDAVRPHERYEDSVSPSEATRKPKIASGVEWSRIIAVAKERVGTNVALAEKLGVSENAVRHWLQGASPPADVIALLYERLGLDPRYLVTGDGEPVSGEAPDSMAGKEQLAAATSSLLTSIEHLAETLAHLLPLLDGSQAEAVKERIRKLAQEAEQATQADE